ncbi:MAG: peptidase [Planctomycetes bacterium]|nr:peptidase [Planctomycetota bacterium]
MRILPWVSATLVLAAGGLARAQQASAAVAIGGRSYTWQKGFAVHLRDAEGKPQDLGNTHGCIVVRKDGKLLANTDTDHAVVVFDADGEVSGTWGENFHGGLHGMCLRVEGGKEVLYLAHTRRHEMVKTTIDGEVLMTIGWPEASGVYGDENEYKPTAVAVAPDGRIFVGDGYGKSWVHCFAADGTYQKSIGGPGAEPGKFRTPHGLWMDARGAEPLLLVCDRENHRLQWFTLDGGFVRMMDQGLRRPCNVWPLPEGGLVVADLVGRISFLDAKDQVVGHFGDNPDEKLRAVNGVPKDRWRDGEFLAPHSVCVDAAGSVYVMDWNASGRISKLTSEVVKESAVEVRKEK